MLLSIIRQRPKGRRGFSLAEMLIAAMIGTMVIASAWSVYVMVWQWWTEMSPRLDVERSARQTLLHVIEGVPDDTTGTYVVGSTTYKRRNGIAWATEYPDISVDGKTITYRLKPDSSNVRQFYIGTYNGEGYMYYKDSNGTSHRIDATKGITDILFEKFEDVDHDIHDNIIKVTATSEEEVYGTRTNQPFEVTVVYTDTVYLRNAL